MADEMIDVPDSISPSPPSPVQTSTKLLTSPMSPSSPLSPSSMMHRKRTVSSKASKRRSSSKKNRSRFSILRKSKRPPRLIRIGLQHDAMIMSESRRALEFGVVSVLVAREVRSLAISVRTNMAPVLGILLWMLGKLSVDREDVLVEDGDALFQDNSIKAEWQRLLATDQRTLKMVDRENEALRLAVENSSLPRWTGINDTIQRMIEEKETKDRFELLTSFDFEREQLLLVESIVSNVGCNLGCMLLCVKLPGVELRFDTDVERDNLGQVKQSALMVPSMRPIEDTLAALLGLEALRVLMIATSNKGVVVGSAVGSWAHRVTKEISAVPCMQRMSRMFLARSFVQKRRTQFRSILCIQNVLFRGFFAKKRVKALRQRAHMKKQTNASFGILSANSGLNGFLGRSLLTPIDPMNLVNAEVVESLCRLHGGGHLINLGLCPVLLSALCNAPADARSYRLSLLRTLALCLLDEFALEKLLEAGAGEVLNQVWTTSLHDLPLAVQCLRVASTLAMVTSDEVLLVLFSPCHVGLGVLLVAMLGADPVSETNPTASICGTATCLALDVLQRVVKLDSLRLELASSTQVIVLLLGVLQMLAEKNELVDQPVRYDPQQELGAVGYYSAIEVDPSVPRTYYPSYRHYRPSYSAVGCAEDKFNLGVAEDWSELRCRRTEPMVLERCAVLLWTLAKDQESWVAIHRQDGVGATCALLRCSRWPLAPKLGCVLLAVLAKPNRRAKLAFMRAGAHSLLQQHLLLGNHETMAAAKEALELLSKTLKPTREGEEDEDQYGDELWGSDTAVSINSMEMQSFLAGWSQGSAVLQFGLDRAFDETPAGDIHVPVGEFCEGWDRRWSQRATGPKPPLFA